MSAPDRLAAVCPGCGLPIIFDELELIAPDTPASGDVMCAFCGTVTRRSSLRRQAYRTGHGRG